MDPQSLLPLLAQGDDWTEHKPGTDHEKEHQGAFRTLIAFANDLSGQGRPGTLLFGVDERQRPQGLAAMLIGMSPKQADNLEQKLSGWARSQVSPPLPLHLEQIPLSPERVILLARTQPDGRIYWFEQSRLLVRERSATLEATKRNGYLDALLPRAAQGVGADPLDAPVPGRPVDALEGEAASVLRSIGGGRSVAELLEPEHRFDAALGGVLARRDGGQTTLSRLGVLLLDPEPQRDIPGAWAEIAHFAGPSRADTARRWRVTGPLLRQIQRVEERLADLNPEWVGADPGGAIGHINRRAFSPQALHELVVNAYAHRDWSQPGELRFEVFSDRLEVTSPGGPPAGLARETLLRGVAPRWRNPGLGAILKEAQVANRFGRGLVIIREETLKLSGQEPRLDIVGEHCVFTLPAWSPPRPGLPARLLIVAVDGSPLPGLVAAQREGLGLAALPSEVVTLPGPDRLDAAALRRALRGDGALAPALHLFYDGPADLALLIGALLPAATSLFIYARVDGLLRPVHHLAPSKGDRTETPPLGPGDRWNSR